MTGEPLPSSNHSGDGNGLPTNRKAIISVVFGVAGFLCLYAFPFGAFALGLPAITTGIHARREIVESGGTERGDGLAAAGLIVGGAAMFFAAVSFVLYVVLDG